MTHASFRSPRMAFASSFAHPGIQQDDRALAEALRARQATVHAAQWDDPTVRWEDYDAVVFRSIWDYFERHPAFLQWIDRLEASGLVLCNDAATVRWNVDKSYLLDLAQAGVEIVPSTVCTKAQLLKIPEAEALSQSARQKKVVVKPTVSGGSWHTWAGNPLDPVFAKAVVALPPHLTYLVQPYLPEIETEGEWSLVFIDGHYSHAVIKRPVPGDFRVQAQFGGSATPASPPSPLVDDALRVLAAVRDKIGSTPAYARVDGVVVDERFLLMEVELIEPVLHLGTKDGASVRLAEALLKRIGQGRSTPPAGTTPDRPIVP
jgi:glutathione synthase/RimK-type ligase-like ATP-grasp enzyme